MGVPLFPVGLHYNYYRYDDPGTGRYYAKDKIIEKIATQKLININAMLGALFYQPEKLNLYCYVLGNPINNVDVFGLFPCPKGQHLEKDRAGFLNCLFQDWRFWGSCSVCVASAWTGAGSPFGIGMCLACLSFELNCAAENSKCVCD